MNFNIIVFDGVDELDALGPMEVLRTAAKLGADIEVRLVTRTEQFEVVGQHGLRFRPDAVYERDGADVLIATGGGWAARASAGVWAEVQRGDWLPILSMARDTTRIMASVCTGAMLLAHAGVIGARPATTHHSALEDLAATGARVLAERVVDDGDLITAAGVTSGIDLALWLLEREFSADLAADTARHLEHAPSRRSVTHGAPPGPITATP